MRRTLPLLTVVALVLAAGVQAQEEPAIDPFAAHVLKEMSAYLSSLDHFTFRGEVSYGISFRPEQPFTTTVGSRE